MRGLNLDHLRSFADVVETGSFSAAAVRLSLTQPAVSLHILQLERRLGVRLIERIGRKATPTAAGRDLLDHVRRIEADVAGAVDAMAFHATGTVGRVVLGTGATACIHLLPPLLRDLRRDHPSLEIVVRTGNSTDVVGWVEGNVVDVGLVTLPVSGRALQVTPVLDDPLVAVFAASDGAAPPDVAAADLAGRPLVLYEAGGHTRRAIDEWFLRSGAALKPIMELGSVEAIKKLIGAGLGCGILPAIAVTAEAREGSLVVRPLAPPLHRVLGIVLRRDKPLLRGLRAVTAALATLGVPAP